MNSRDFKVRYEKYNHGPWRYADIFWKQIGGKAEMTENRSEGLAIAKLYDFEKNTKDNSVSDADKAINLAWFLHVAGDVHNPLHNASSITDVDPKGDSGDNLFLPSPAGAVAAENRVDRHSYWDSVLRRNAPRENTTGDGDYITQMAEKIIKKPSSAAMKERSGPSSGF